MLRRVGRHVTIDLEQEKALRAVDGVACVLDRLAASKDDAAYAGDSAMFEMLATVLQDSSAALAVSMGCAVLDVPATKGEATGN